MSVAVAGTQADPIGEWWTEDDLSRIRVYACGDSYCARILEMKEPLDEEGRPRLDRENPDPNLRERPIEGLEILRIPADPDKQGVWRGGRIYDPQSGRTYKCILWQEGDLLKLKGYIGIPLLGRKTTWRPAPS